MYMHESVDSYLSKVYVSLFVIAGGRMVAFTATMSQMSGCFGPFTCDVPIPYGNVTLNHGNGYNPALGTQHHLHLALS